MEVDFIVVTKKNRKPNCHRDTKPEKKIERCEVEQGSTVKFASVAVETPAQVQQEIQTPVDNFISDRKAIERDPSLIEQFSDNPSFLKKIAEHLPERCVEARVRIQEKHPGLLPVWNIIDSITKYELTYLAIMTNFRPSIYAEGSKIKTSNLPPHKVKRKSFCGPQTCPQLEPGLINVYNHFESFRLVPLAPSEKAVPFLFLGKHKPWRPSMEDPVIHYSIPSKEKFIERFELFTQGQLSGWKDWSNMVVVGGAVANCLLPVPSCFEQSVGYFYERVAYKTSDIDIYFYGLSNEQFSNKLIKLYTFLKRKNPTMIAVKTPHTVTFCSEYPNRHIQVVIGEWQSLEHILFEPDIDCSCFAFDNTTLWTTQRGRFSMNHRAIVASGLRYQVRGHPEYECRLAKYSKRGFVIWDKKLDWHKISWHYLKKGYDYMQQSKSVIQGMEVFGLRLLILLHKYKEDFKDTDISTIMSGETTIESEMIFAKVGIPFGRTWSLPRLIKGLEEGAFVPTNYGLFCINRFTILHDLKAAREEFKTTSTKLLVEAGRNTNWDRFWYNRIFIKDEIAELQDIKKNGNWHGRFKNNYTTYKLKNRKVDIHEELKNIKIAGSYVHYLK